MRDGGIQVKEDGRRRTKISEGRRGFMYDGGGREGVMAREEERVMTKCN